MRDLLSFGITVAMGFFAIMNPIGNAPIYLGLVDGYSEDKKKRIAARSVTFAFLIVAVFVLFGGIIFRIFGITIQAFQIAGGILVFLVGYQLLHGKESLIHHPEPQQNKVANESEDIAVTPLSIPILAGPGTISCALSFTASGASIVKISIVLGVFAFICALTYISFIFSERIVSFLKASMVKVVTRLMGLILTIIAVQMVIEGIRGAVG